MDDIFTGVADSLALIRLRRTLLADLAGKLTNLLLIDTRYNDLVGLGYVERWNQFR